MRVCLPSIPQWLPKSLALARLSMTNGTSVYVTGRPGPRSATPKSCQMQMSLEA